MEGGTGFDQLFAHQEWVRSLALRLCADTHAADDLTQDAWVAALQSRSPASRTRAWLGGVLRNLARKESGRAGARRERERRAAKPERAPSPDELMAQAELQRRVLAAVASLDEIYRDVVLMHHYEGTRLEEIAARIGCPASTVRNRLARAHAALRAKLDCEYGERARWSGVLAPSALWSAHAKLATGLGVAVKMELAGAAVFVAAAAVWMASRPGGTTEAHRPLDAASRASLPSAPATEDRASNEPSVAPRAPVPPGPEALVDRILVSGRLRGVTGKPADPSGLHFVDRRGEDHGATLGSDASYSIFDLASGHYSVVAQVRGYRPLWEELVLDGRTAHVQHDIALEPCTVLPIRLIDRETREPLEPSYTDPLLRALGAVATFEPPRTVGGLRTRLPLSYGVGIYREQNGLRLGASAGDPWGEIEVRVAPPFYVSLILHDAVIESRLVQGGETELTFAIDRADLLKSTGSLHARVVVRSTGAPVVGARVDLSYLDGGVPPVQTDAQGELRAEGLAPGLRRLVIAANGPGRLARWIEIEPGRTLDLGTLELAPTVLLRGRVIGPDGAGVAARLRACRPVDGSAPPAAGARNDSSSQDGVFGIAQQEAAPLRVTATAEGCALAWVDVDATAGDVDGIELRLRRGSDVLVRTPRGEFGIVDVVLLDSMGTPLSRATSFATHPARWTLQPGSYAVRAECDGRTIETRALEVGAEPVNLELAPFR